MGRYGGIMNRIPGILLCLAIGLVAFGLQWVQEISFGTAWIDGLPLAIALGMGVRLFWRPGARWEPGIQFMARRVLELAIVLLGASLDAGTLRQTPPALILATGGLVVGTIGAGYLLGRLCGLGRQLALLVASGNAICGNSAISAIAPVIDAEEKDVALAISLTAILGILVVVLLPFLAPWLHLSHREYGILAGWSVYAVPQVLAAAYPVSVLSGQVGALVKLLRVLMLGPVVLVFGWMQRRPGRVEGATDAPRRAPLLPWFILGFVALAAVRSLGGFSPAQAEALHRLSSGLTLAAMASLGLMADARSLLRSGNRAAIAAAGSLLLLVGGALVLIRGLGL